MPIPYLLTTLLYLFVALFAAADASLVSLNLVNAFPALRTACCTESDSRSTRWQ